MNVAQTLRANVTFSVGAESQTVTIEANALLGMFFERVQGNDIYGTDVNPPFAYQPSVNAIYFSNPNQSSLNGATASSPTSPANFTSLACSYPDPGTIQFSLGVQQEVAPSVVASMQYVGVTGWHQNIQRAVNTLPFSDPGTGLFTERQAVAGGENVNFYRMFPGWGNITQTENATNSSYHSFQTALRMEAKHWFFHSTRVHMIA